MRASSSVIRGILEPRNPTRYLSLLNILLYPHGLLLWAGVKRSRFHEMPRHECHIGSLYLAITAFEQNVVYSTIRFTVACKGGWAGPLGNTDMVSYSHGMTFIKGLYSLNSLHFEQLLFKE